MRFYEFAFPDHHREHYDPRRSLSLYIMNGEYADYAAMIRHYDGRVVGVTRVPVGGMTLQVTCPTVNDAYELFASWLDHKGHGPHHPRTDRKRAT